MHLYTLVPDLLFVPPPYSSGSPASKELQLQLELKSEYSSFNNCDQAAGPAEDWKPQFSLCWTGSLPLRYPSTCINVFPRTET